MTPHVEYHTVTAFDPQGNQVGKYGFAHKSSPDSGNPKMPQLYPTHANTEEAHQRKGLASAAYALIQNKVGKKLSPSPLQTKHAQKLWESSNRPFGKSEDFTVIVSLPETEDLIKADEYPFGPKEMHPTKGYTSTKWNNNWVWQHGPEIASTHDAHINDPKLIQSLISKMPTPKHKKAMEAVISKIQKDPNRHVIPTLDYNTNRHVLRARHLKKLLFNDGNFSIDTSNPDQLKIIAHERHGAASGPTEFTYNIKVKGATNVQKSIGDDSNGNPSSSGRLRHGSAPDMVPRGNRAGDEDSGPGRDGSSWGEQRPDYRVGELSLLRHLLEDKKLHWSEIYNAYKPLQAPIAQEDGSQYLHDRPLSDIMVRTKDDAEHKALSTRNTPEAQLLMNMLENGAIKYHPKHGFKWHQAQVPAQGAPLAMSENEPVKLIHFSRVKGLKSIDPQHMGTGAPSQETRRGLPEVRRSYFYRANSEPESIVTQGAASKYHVNLQPEHKLYDLANDHEGHIKAAVDANNGAYNSDLVLGRIRDAGYHGFYNSQSSLPHVVALFHSTPVDREEMP
jgi:hypothetical protein